MTNQVRIQDDLFAALNGEWLATYQIPADRARHGSFHALSDEAEANVRQILEDCAAAPQDDEQRHIGALYRSFMDTETIEQLGIAPLHEYLRPLAQATTKDELVTVLGKLSKQGLASPIQYHVYSDMNHPGRYCLYFGQDGLGLPDESYYHEDAHAATREKYVSHLARMIELAQVRQALGMDPHSDPQALAQRIMAVETELAKGHRDRVELRDIQRRNNPTDAEEMQRWSGAFPFTAWREAADITDAHMQVVICYVPEFFVKLGQVWQDTDLEDLKLWIALQVVTAAAPYMNEELTEANFDMYGRTLTGAEELRDRWKRGVDVVESAVGEAVGKIYVARHFPAEHKQMMDELVANLIEAYRQSISELEWMTAETKAKALDKLAAFTPKIGHPQNWRDYSGLKITDGKLLDSVVAAREFAHDYDLERLSGPVNRDEWLMTPQTVNAYYMPTMNEIAFPAAILQPPFFDVNADEATNYGAIGAVIGHEIGHGFDDQGSQFDGRGQVLNWWTDKDREEFEKRTASLIEQYDSFTPSQLPTDSGHHVNGALTIGENIGDLGGLSIGLKALKIALEKQGLTLETAPEVDGLTALQRLFYSWARIWREKARDEEIIRLLTIDPHSPAEFRCNGVPRNMDAFYEAFDVKEGDGMWLEPEKRVTIW